MLAEIISIGNELLNGNTVNTNAVFIAQRLHECGIEVNWIQTVGDKPDDIRMAIDLAIKRADKIIMTGGLGPTHDDVTKNTLASYFHSDLEFNEMIYKRIKARFNKRGIPMPEENRVQAMIPRTADLILNEAGSAPGLIFKSKKKLIFVMPGVPQEMGEMLNKSVIPILMQECVGCHTSVHIFRTTGIAESVIYQRIKKALLQFSEYEVAFLPKVTGVDLRIIRRGTDSKNSEKFENLKNILYNAIGNYIYTTENLPLEAVLGKLLVNNKLTIGVAESLTGGLVQNKLTNIPGSSAYFMGGIVSYSNESKVKLLSVKKDTLVEHGAVSKEVAKEMAMGVRGAFHTDIGVSTTGIAGPTGATPQKPVGLVYIGLSYGPQTIAQKYQFADNREVNKMRSAQAALELVRRSILGLDI
jgi:nicotinamide-nucleotide amidase